MDSFTLFKTVQASMHRKYRGTMGKFLSSKWASYYENLCEIMNFELKYDRIIKNYIFWVKNEENTLFNPFELHDKSKIQRFKQFVKDSESPFSYKNKIKECVDEIYKFCRRKGIYDLEEYKRRWGKQHVISGFLNDNIAYLLEVHKLPLTKPEKTLMSKKFLNRVDLIEERLKKHKNIKKFIDSKLSLMEMKLESYGEKMKEESL